MDILVVNGGQWAATRTHALYDFYNTDQVEGMIQAFANDVLPVRVLKLCCLGLVALLKMLLRLHPLMQNA
jgi:hypothetical protein